MKFIKILFVLSLFSIAFMSCDDDNPSKNDNDLKIISFQPANGPVGSSVYITIDNFEGTASQLTVKFTDDLTAEITEMVVLETNYRRLKVVVPEGAVTGKISVTYAGTTAETLEPFTVTNPVDGMLPEQVGTYWKYDTFELDSLNQIVDESSPRLDSVIIAGTIVKLGQEASIFERYVFSEGQYDLFGQQYYYESDGKIYTYSNIVDELLDMSGYPIVLPFEIDEQWFKVVDPNETEWPLFSKTFDKDTIGGYVISGTLTLTGLRNGVVPTLVMGSSFEAHKYSMSLSFLGSIIIMNSPPLDFDLTRVVDFYFVEGYGEVKREMKAMVINIPGSPAQIVPGYQSVLTDFRTP